MRIEYIHKAVDKSYTSSYDGSLYDGLSYDDDNLPIYHFLYYVNYMQVSEEEYNIALQYIIKEIKITNNK